MNPSIPPETPPQKTPQQGIAHQELQPQETQPQEEDHRAKKPPLVIEAEQAQAIYRSLKLGKAIALSSYVGLLLTVVLLYLINPDSSLALLVVQLFPLLIFIPGLLRNTHRTYSWLCFVVLMYFVAIIPLVMGRGLWSDWLITLLCTSLFCSAMMTSRWLQYWNYYQQQERQKAAANQS